MLMLPGCDASRPGLAPPYLRKVATKDSVVVWVVDGAYVRDSIDVEFTNFGQHYAFDRIPRHEFWLDREAAPDEEKFFVDHLLVEYDLMGRGVPYDSALQAGDQAELVERVAAGDPAKVMGRNGLPDPAKVHVSLWRRLESGTSVWIVDGRLVRSAFDIDFTEGGHEHVYEFVPPNEIWIDNDLASTERKFVLYHELHERKLMATGWTYAKAHDDANRMESYYRRHPSELHNGLASDGWE